MADKLYSLINIKRIHPCKKNKMGYFQIIAWDKKNNKIELLMKTMKFLPFCRA